MRDNAPFCRFCAGELEAHLTSTVTYELKLQTDLQLKQLLKNLQSSNYEEHKTVSFQGVYSV